MERADWALQGEGAINNSQMQWRSPLVRRLVFRLTDNHVVDLVSSAYRNN